VLVAALVASGLCHEVVHRCLHAHAVVSSAALLDELERTLREKFSLTPQARAFLRQLRTHISLVDAPPLPSPVCRDPEDDVVLATAVAARADAVITGDQDLLVLKRYERVRILTPREFIEATALGKPMRR
jgi:putative PIN family toxin of toxin-antitoxin system